MNDNDTIRQSKTNLSTINTVQIISRIIGIQQTYCGEI